MLILDTTTKSLEIILGGAVATNQLPFVVGYVDVKITTMAMTAITEGDGLSNGGTAVTMSAAPGVGSSRQIKFLSIFQSDTAAATVTIRVNNNGTFRNVWQGLLAVGDNLLYTDDVFVITDKTGGLKTTSSTHALLDGTIDNDTTATAPVRGALIVANSTPKWTSLLIGAVNTVLHGGTDPTYSAIVNADIAAATIDLTAKVTGLLPVANGGTGAGAFTAGSVVFAGASGVYTQNNANFFWDNLNKRLGLGTAVPGGPLDISTNITALPPAPTPVTLLHLGAADANETTLLIDGFGGAGVIDLRRADGPNSAKTAVQATEALGVISFHGYGATGYSSNRRAQIRGDAAENWTDTAQGTRVSFATTPKLSTTMATRMLIDDAGNIGINTLIPIARLHVADVNQATDNNTQNVRIVTTDAMSIDKGGMIGLGGVYTGTTTYCFGQIAGRKENSTDGNAAGYLQFATPNSGGTITEWMRLTSAGILNLVKTVGKYNNIATVSGGVPAEYATVDLTAQGAAIIATTLYAVPASGVGMYRIAFVAKVTQAATTSSTLGGAAGFQLLYTDADDSVVVTTPKETFDSDATTLALNTTQVYYAGVLIVSAKASTNIRYQMDYTSIGVTPMQFNLHIKCEAL